MSRKLLIATVAVLALPLAACGEDSSSTVGPEKNATPAFAKKSGEDIFRAAATAMRDAGPVGVAGNIVDDGEKIEFDVRTNGPDECTGTLTQQGGTARFVVASGSTYIKGDEGFWRSSVGDEAEQAMDFFGDRWVKAPSDDEFTQLCDLSQLLDLESAEGDDVPRDVKVGEVSEIDGHQVVQLTAKDDEDDQEFAVYVETGSPHRILKLESKDPKDPGQISFDFDAEVDVEEPAKGEYVEVPTG